MKDHREYINKLRYDFSKGELSEATIAKTPIAQFEKWFKEAVDAKVPDANAMVLSTASKKGIPSARVLLLRNFGEEGFVFYTNYHSRKGEDMNENPFAAMSFFWQPLERQVRIEGEVIRQNKEGSDLYFEARPRGSKLGAWASPQSKPIPNRSFLDEKLKQLDSKFEGDAIPRPEFWGGYILKPTSIEFWQGRPSRLHDRIRYSLDKGKWVIERLAP